MYVSRSARMPRSLLVPVVLAAALLPACGKKVTAPAAKPPAEVSVITVEPRDTPAVFEYVAQTQSSRQVNIQARVNGFLDKRVYTEGSLVKEGQVLFLMDKKPFQAQVDAAQAQVSKAQAALDVAKSNLARVKPLTEKEALAARRPEPAGQGALRVREARAAAVRRRLHVLHDGTAGGAAALPRRAEPGHHPRAALRVVRRHLPGARRRVDRQGGRALAAADGRHLVTRRGEGGGKMRAWTWAL